MESGASTVYTRVNLFVFLWSLVWFCDFDRAVRWLCKYYDAENLVVNPPWMRPLYIARTSAAVHRVLTDESLVLSWMDRNFLETHQFEDTIVGWETNDLRFKEHKHLIETTVKNMDDRLGDIVEKWIGVITDKTDGPFVIEEVVDEFLANVWSEYSYGENVDKELYEETYGLIRAYLAKHFHSRWFVRLPWVGRYFVRRDVAALTQIKAGLYQLLSQRDPASFMGKYGSKPLMDTAFLQFLPREFLHSFLVNYLANEMDVTKGLDKGFLYPWRFREGANAIYAVDLVSAGLRFSAGPRRCLGQGVFRMIVHVLGTTAKNHQELHVLPDGRAEWRYSRAALQNLIDCHDGRWQITDIFLHPGVFRYAIRRICEEVDRVKPDYIVSSEARGWLVAGAVAEYLGVKLICMRKPGKLAGKVVSASGTMAYADVTLEVTGKTRIPRSACYVIVDDGINSGGTVQIMRELMTMVGNPRFRGVFTIVNHGSRDHEFKTFSVFDL